MNLVTRGLGSTHDNLPTWGLGAIEIIEIAEKTRPFGGRLTPDKLRQQQIREDEELLVLIHAFMESVDD